MAINKLLPIALGLMMATPTMAAPTLDKILTWVQGKVEPKYIWKYRGTTRWNEQQLVSWDGCTVKFSFLEHTDRKKGIEPDYYFVDLNKIELPIRVGDFSAHWNDEGKYEMSARYWGIKLPNDYSTYPIVHSDKELINRIVRALTDAAKLCGAKKELY